MDKEYPTKIFVMERGVVQEGNKGRIIQFFKWLKSKVFHLFEPEEVEVTFEQKDGHIVYTYTKVEHKPAA